MRAIESQIKGERGSECPSSCVLVRQQDVSWNDN